MNAAAKAINQTTVFNGHLLEMRLSKRWCLLLLLLLALLTTALAIVYTTNQYRLRFSQLEQLQAQTSQLQLHWGRLLLEQASLETPGRVEAFAVQRLQMKLPRNKEIFVLRTL